MAAASAITLPRRELLGSPQLHQEVGGTFTWKQGSGERVGAAWFPPRQDRGGGGGVAQKVQAGRTGLGCEGLQNFQSLEALRFAFFLRLFPIIIQCLFGLVFLNQRTV